jgi:hypothetical protein
MKLLFSFFCATSAFVFFSLTHSLFFYLSLSTMSFICLIIAVSFHLLCVLFFFFHSVFFLKRCNDDWKLVIVYCNPKMKREGKKNSWSITTVGEVWWWEASILYSSHWQWHVLSCLTQFRVLTCLLNFVHPLLSFLKRQDDWAEWVKKCVWKICEWGGGKTHQHVCSSCMLHSQIIFFFILSLYLFFFSFSEKENH